MLSLQPAVPGMLTPQPGPDPVRVAQHRAGPAPPGGRGERAGMRHRWLRGERGFPTSSASVISPVLSGRAVEVGRKSHPRQPSLQHSNRPIPPYLFSKQSQLRHVSQSISSALPSSGFCRDAGPSSQLRHETMRHQQRGQGLSRITNNPCPCPN